MKWFLVAALSIGFYAQAEDFPGSDSKLEDEFTKGFGENHGMKAEDSKKVEADRMKLGGSLMAEYQLYTFKDQVQDNFVATPMTLQMYLDAQLKNDLRAFFKGRMVHDGSVDETKPNPLTGQIYKQTNSYLDELKLSFHSHRKVFWTLGRQKIKWGAAKFWNPTDFINLQRRDFLRQEDERTGISMIKAHVPWKDANFYLIAVNEGASESKQTGTAARFEIPFSAGEWTASRYYRQGQDTKIGTDLSVAIKDIDVYIEAAQSEKGGHQSRTGGLSYEFKYNDDDTATLGIEKFWQEDGVTDTTLYPAMLIAGTWQPFQVAQNYGLLSLYLPKPGKWNDSSFMLYYIRNLDDESAYYRAAWSYTGIDDITWTTSLGTRSGADDSEMKAFGQEADALVQAKVSF